MDAALRNLLRVLPAPGRDGSARESILREDRRRNGGDAAAVGAESSKELARQATDESIVLLKNENNTLPLDRTQAEDHCGDRAVDRPRCCWTGTAERRPMR